MTQNPAHPFAAKEPASSPTPMTTNTHTNPTIVPENETPEKLTDRNTTAIGCCSSTKKYTSNYISHCYSY